MHLPARFLLTTRYSPTALPTLRWPPYKRVRESHRARRMKIRSRMSPGAFHRIYQRMMRRRRRIILPVLFAHELVPKAHR